METEDQTVNSQWQEFLQGGPKLEEGNIALRTTFRVEHHLIITLDLSKSRLNKSVPMAILTAHTSHR